MSIDQTLMCPVLFQFLLVWRPELKTHCKENLKTLVISICLFQIILYEKCLRQMFAYPDFTISYL